jgi:tetratricopeptide (TPR) repeat protein
MSRSIHATLRQLEEAKRYGYAWPQQRRAHVEQINALLDRKRIVKAYVGYSRQTPMPQAPPVDVECIPIQVYDQNEYIYYPASVEDVRAVMRRLPAGTLDGLRRIELCLGRQYQRKALDVDDFPLESDPYVGRLGVEICPGVFAGRYSGTYFSQQATIRLYAYVYAPSLPNRKILEVYLRLCMLSTLLHEIAHHMQRVIQGQRGRWCVAPGELTERDAEQREYQWAQAVAAPYLEQTYPKEVKALYEWMAFHGGAAISLAALAEAPVEPGLWSSQIAFESLVEAVHTQQPLKETRLGFANNLYHAEHHAEALQIIERVLVDHPQDAEALTLQAHVYNRQKRYAEAEQIALAVISSDERCVDAWKELAAVAEAQGNWRLLEQATTKVIELSERLQIFALGDRARARLELGQFQEAEADMEALAAFQGKGSLVPKMVTVLKAVLLLRTGHFQEAWEIATVSLKRPWSTWRCMLSAIRLEAAQHLGKPCEAPHG